LNTFTSFATLAQSPRSTSNTKRFSSGVNTLIEKIR
jgi:hypothetical protein